MQPRRRCRPSLAPPPRYLLCGLSTFGPPTCSPNPPTPRSPLKGNGLPQLETDKVYVSAYLDRLLGVNEDDYRFEVAGGCS